VLGTRIAPGDTVPIHTHRWPAANLINSWSDFVRRDVECKVMVDTRGRLPPTGLPAAVLGEALPAHPLENAGSAELHAVSIEVRTAPRGYMKFCTPSDDVLKQYGSILLQRLPAGEDASEPGMMPFAQI